MADQIMHSLLVWLKEVNSIIDTYTDGMMPFEQANVIARFYYVYQDTNLLIDEAEKMATEDTGSFREIAVSLKDKTATLLNNIGKLDSIDFRS